MWRHEVLNFYPKSLEYYPESWVSEIRKLSRKDQWLIDTGVDFSAISNIEMKQLFDDLQKASAIPQIDIEQYPFKKSDFFRMKVKKAHEISRIIPFLDKRKNSFEQFIDVGGGVGHLSRTTAQKLKKKEPVLNLTLTLLPRGKEFLKFRRTPAFLIKMFPFKRCFTKKASCADKTLLMGLHACGPLSNDIISYAVQSEIGTLLNFGCCYFKCDPQSQMNISEEAKKNPLPWTTHALTLASRAHTGFEQEDFNKKLLVKNYRYALHLYLYHEVQTKEFKEVGESNFRVYQNSFGDYALSKLDYLKIDHDETAQSLNTWFSQAWVQEKVDEMFCANIIRWRFGRALGKILITRPSDISERTRP